MSVDLLAPPDDATVGRAVADYVRAIRKAYGPRLKAVYLFGSRARGDHTPESDADVAVVLKDGDWDYWVEKMRMADLEYDVIVETGVEPQGWPIRESEWANPDSHRNPGLVRAIRRDSVEIRPAS